LWDKEYNGKTHFIFKANDGTINSTKQYLQNEYFDYLIRDNRILSIIEKTQQEKKFSKIVSRRMPYGIETDLFNNLKKYPELNLKFEQFDESVKIYGVKGIKGGAKRISGFVKKEYIVDSIKTLKKYKLFFSKTYSTNAVNFPKVIKGYPNEICTSTFLMIGSFSNQKEQLNCLGYMETKFFKTLLYFGKGTMNVTKSVFKLIPVQDFSESWSDEKLYKKYNLTSEEIEFIESMFRSKEINNG
jgi:hypothetical protein